MKHDKTAAERSARYYENQKRKGFVRLSVWVHKTDKEKLHEYADELEAKHKNG